MTLEQWMEALAAESRRLLQIHQNWEFGPDEKGLKPVGELLADWKTRNPMPASPKITMPPLSSGGGAVIPREHLINKTGNLNAELERVRNLETMRGDYRLLSRARKSKEGASLLVTLLALGTGSVLAIGAAALKMVLEECAWRVGGNIFGWVIEQVGYATMPTTRGQFEAIYRNYVSYKLGKVADIRLNPYGAEPQILSKQEYCWEAYGLQLSVLK